MRPIRALSLLYVGVLAGACATSGQLHDDRLFLERPPKPEGCEFEVYEQREPPRKYEVIGTLHLTDNERLGERGRKGLLAETVCKAGADAVILSRPVERTSAAGRVRDYEAQFISFSLGSSAEESVGESSRQWEPEKAEPQQPTK